MREDDQLRYVIEHEAASLVLILLKCPEDSKTRTHKLLKEHIQFLRDIQARYPQRQNMDELPI